MILTGRMPVLLFTQPHRGIELRGSCAVQSIRFGVMVCLAMSGNAWAGNAARLGMFEGATDIGKTSHGGEVEFRSDSGEYVVTGGGANIWGNADAFQVV